MPDYASRRTMMVDTQVRPSDVTKYPIIAAMLEVPRERFVPSALREAAYAGENVAIGPGRVLLEPRTIGKMLDALDLQSTDVVLDIAAGTGYLAALMARLAETVIAVESDPDLAAEAEAALAAEGADTVAVITGAPEAGAPRHGPYDAIVIEGGVETVPPALIAQLKEGGRIACIFMEGAVGTCRIGLRGEANGGVHWRPAFHATAPVLAGFKHQQTFVL